MFIGLEKEVQFGGDVKMMTSSLLSTRSLPKEPQLSVKRAAEQLSSTLGGARGLG